MWTDAEKTTATRVAAILVGLFIIMFTLLFDKSWSSYLCVWIGCLLLKKSFVPQDSPPRRRHRPSCCPKPFTPSAPIRVVSAHSSRPARNRIPASALLFPKDVSSYNDESFMTGSTDCTPVSEPLLIPDSIAAIWEPTVEPTSSRVW